MPDEAGVTVDALPEAEAAEMLAETMALLGGRFEAIMEDLHGPVSSYVTSALSTYEENTLEDVQATARSGTALTQTGQGSVGDRRHGQRQRRRVPGGTRGPGHLHQLLTPE